MLSALLYLHFQSLGNQLAQRARRLQQPRYFFGAIIGGAYLLLMFSRSFLPLLRGGRQAAPALFPGLAPGTWEFIFGLALAAGAVLAWAVPHQRAALVFTEAEIAFLFPAPITRRTLVLFKLVRSQVSVLFTVFFLTIIFHGTNGLEGALLRAVGYWVILSTINLHLLGSSFARTLLLDHGLTLWRRRLLVLVLVGGLAAVAVYWVRATVPLPDDGDWQSPATFEPYLDRVARSVPAVFLLGPFRAVARPFVLSDQPPRFLLAIWTALAFSRCISCGWSGRTWPSRKPAWNPPAATPRTWPPSARAGACPSGPPDAAARPSTSRRPVRPPWRSCGRTCSARASSSTRGWPSACWRGRSW